MNTPSLVDITTLDIDVELIYADARNFTGKPVYPPGFPAKLHRDAAEKLEVAARLAKYQGWRLLVWDAYRPPAAQWTLWNHTPDPQFLADPRRGSPHSRGVAVDLTLTKAGKPLDMGSDFDAFTPRSHHANCDIAAHCARHRLLLLGLMTSAGWDCYLKEWWHYQLFDSAAYPLIEQP